MGENDCEVKDVHFVPETLDIPILLAGRNRFKYDPFRTVPTYIKKKQNFYAKNCSSEARKSTKTREEFKRLIAKYPAHDESCHESRRMKTERYPIIPRGRHLPPNIYNISYVPFSSRQGLGGAYWEKLKKENNMPKGKWKFYTIPNGMDRLYLPENKYKGIFLSNPRNRRATARCMITDPVLIYHDPLEPSPAYYNVKNYTVSYNMAPRKYHPKQNPHLFGRHSCVPEHMSCIIPRHLSFQPSVGRYETRYPKHCPCGKKIFTPGLPLLVDAEKRKRFRRIPYKKIKIDLLCDPDWEHVTGHGHQHVFRLPGSKKHKPQIKLRTKEEKRFQKSMMMFHDFRYMKMITDPIRARLSRIHSYYPLQPNIRYNCIFKTTMRRIIRIDRKVGFGGGAPRFHNYFPTVLTKEQLKQIIRNLPPERRLRNQSITKTPIEDIKSRLSEIPQHMKAIHNPILRKNFFKFPKPPVAKLLVTKKDLLPDLPPNTSYKPTRLFNKPIDVTDYLDNVPEKEVSDETLDVNDNEHSAN